jgi:hypothetical protein
LVSKYRRVLLPLGLGISALILIALAPTIHRQLDDWKLLPRPEKLTELYFTDHTKLPSSYAPGQQQPVNFTVHNLEYATTNYKYTIIQTSEDGSKSQTLSTGSFTIAESQYKNTSLPVTLADLGPRSKITVTLSTQEAISYWVNKGAI